QITEEKSNTEIKEHRQSDAAAEQTAHQIPDMKEGESSEQNVHSPGLEDTLSQGQGRSASEAGEGSSPRTLPPGNSLVYSATPRTVFEKDTSSASPNPLNLVWAFGINRNVPVFTLHGKVILYTCGQTAVMYDYHNNSQHLLQGHCRSISCLCVSEDRRWVATADKSSESLVIIWDSYSGIPVQTIFNCHPDGGVTAMAITPDAKYLATIGADVIQRVCIWDWTTNREGPVCSVQLNLEVGLQNYIIFNPRDYTQLLSNSDKCLLFYAWLQEEQHLTYLAPLLTEKVSFLLLGRISVHAIYFSLTTLVPTTLHFNKAALTRYRKAQLHTAASFIRYYSKAAVACLLSLGCPVTTLIGNYFVTCDARGHVKFYDGQFQLLHSYSHFKLGPIRSISFSKHPPTPASDKTRYPTDCTIKGQQFPIRNFVISTSDATVVHVTTKKTKLRYLIQEHSAPVHAVSCHPSQPFISIASYCGILKVWDYEKKKCICSRIFDAGKQIQCLAYDPKGLLIGVGFTDGSVHVLDALTLNDECMVPLKFSKNIVTLITFSHDSQYLAIADGDFAVVVFQIMTTKNGKVWEFLGKQKSHYKPIKSIMFGIHFDSDQPRLLSLGMDRVLVEYDLVNSIKDDLKIQSRDWIEQSAIPKCMTWYPPVCKEYFIITANDQYKMKLYNTTTKMCRKTMLGPTYGSPVEKIVIIPAVSGYDAGKRYLAYITTDKVGLQILPVDGNPHKSNAIICHSEGVSNLACSYDGHYVFTAGVDDCTVLVWETNFIALEAAAALGGEDLIPFYRLLDGGRKGELFRELEDYFYYMQLRSQSIDTMDTRQVSIQIPLTEVPFVMRALGVYPSEQEVEDMLNEVKFSKYVDTGKYVTDIDLGEFIKLYVNHRPAFGLSVYDLQHAFEVLGYDNEQGEKAIDRGELLQMLQSRGEHMTEEELAEYLTTLLGVNPEGGRSELGTYDSAGAAALLEQEIPEVVTTNLFATEILHLPTYESETEPNA
uniref:Cilia- and flagella-associated protein 251 n=1 Tax=Latimeria chalumnae TaxID=7897 RepID=H3BG34_LATCH